MKFTRWLYVAAVLFPCVPIHATQRRSFRVEDSIGMTRFSDPSASELNAHVKFSPDGANFAIVTSRGILASNSIESTLSIYATKAVTLFAQHPQGAPPSPTRLAHVVAVPQVIATAPNVSMISAVQWSPDSRSIYFLAQDGAGNRRLSRVDVQHHMLRTLSQTGEDVYQYAVSPHTVIFCGLRSIHSQKSFIPIVDRDSYAATGIPLEDLILQDDKFAMVVRRVSTLDLDSRRITHLASLDENQHFTPDPLDSALSVSPDGKHAALLIPVTTAPAIWANYMPASGLEHLRIDPRDKRRTSSTDLNFNRLAQFSIIDLRDGMLSVLGAPVARQLGYFSKSKAVWSSDGQMVVLTNTFLPLTDLEQSEDVARPCAAAVVTVSNMHFTCIASSGRDAAFSDRIGKSQLEDVSFDPQKNVELLTSGYGGMQTIRRYARNGSHWRWIGNEDAGPTSGTTLEQIESSKRIPLYISIEQNLNERPTLNVRVKSSVEPHRLWDPNPQLDRIALGEASVLTWKDAQGTVWKGGLVKPPDYIPGKRYPLVIQMYQFHEREFMTDGMATTAMAARSLASAGIMFLQITKQAHTFNETEMETHLGGMLSAIDSLDQKGLVDPAHVGLIGFSASCPYVEYALAKAPARFAAATIADGIDYSFMQAMLWDVSNVGVQEQYERMNGGPPFGKSLQRWFQVALGFHLDTIATPVRIEAIRPASLLSEWELYSSLQQQGKPVDLIYTPRGQHILQKPRDRMVSQQGNVDWFLFWLKGQQQQAPVDRLEYQRWGALKR